MGSVIVIPARGGSKNIPRKNLQLIKNRPLISYAIEIAFKVKSVEKVIVSTEVFGWNCHHRWWLGGEIIDGFDHFTLNS